MKIRKKKLSLVIPIDEGAKFALLTPSKRKNRYKLEFFDPEGKSCRRCGDYTYNNKSFHYKCRFKYLRGVEAARWITFNYDLTLWKKRRDDGCLMQPRVYYYDGKKHTDCPLNFDGSEFCSYCGRPLKRRYRVFFCRDVGGVWFCSKRCHRNYHWY